MHPSDFNNLMVKLFMVISLTATISACGSDDKPNNNNDASQNTSEETYIYRQLEKQFCHAVLDTTHGYLCAIRPSMLDSSARDIFAAGSAPDENFGFGYHAIAFPAAGTNIKGVYIHFTGSMGRAYDQNNDRFPSTVILDEAMAAGFITIQIAYHNRYSVNSPAECQGALDVDNCAGLVRREKITGEDQTPVVDVPVADSIQQRLIHLINYLQSNGFEFPVPVISNNELQWQNVYLGGHSQGAGHALYITKYWNSAHTCLLGGIIDVPDNVPEFPAELIADWFLDNRVTVDITKVRALLSTDDEFYPEFIRAYDVLKLIEDQHWQSFTAAAYFDQEGNTISGHGAAVHDPAFAAQRNTACFTTDLFN